MTGVKAIADALSVNTSMKKLNVLRNSIDAEGAQALVDAAPSQLQTLCGLEEGQTDADLSNQGLGTGGAILLAWELTTGYVSSSMTSLDVSSNELTKGAFNNETYEYDTDMTGIKAVADALSVSSSMTSLK